MAHWNLLSDSIIIFCRIAAPGDHAGQWAAADLPVRLRGRPGARGHGARREGGVLAARAAARRRLGARGAAARARRGGHQQLGQPGQAGADSAARRGRDSALQVNIVVWCFTHCEFPWQTSCFNLHYKRVFWVLFHRTTDWMIFEFLNGIVLKFLI